MSLAWTALDPTPTADSILALNLAGDWGEFRDAAAGFDVPSQNLVYADREGHIGYQAPGRIPIRKPGNDGYLPAEGWRADDDWTRDYVPFEGLPHVLDPDEGYIVTANQQVIGGDYPYFLTDDWDPGFRAQRIRDLLEREGGAVGGRDGGAAARRPAPDGAGARAPPPGAGPARAATTATASGCSPSGTSPSRPTVPRRRTTTWCGATCSSSPSTTTCRRRPGPTGGGRWMLAVEDLLEQPGNSWWDNRDTERRGGDARRRAPAGDARRRATS